MSFIKNIQIYIKNIINECGYNIDNVKRFITRTSFINE